MSTWRPGETVVLRYFNRGRPVGAMPTRMVSADESIVLWLPPGAPTMRPGINGRFIRDVPAEERYGTTERTPVLRHWTGEGIVIVGRPGRAHSIWLFWEGADFAGWYVNLEAPWQPTRIGFDTQDHTLDLWVERDGSWRWKDEDELAVAVEHGLVSREQANAFRAEGERVIEEWPFPTGWENWRPDPSWPTTELPADWMTS
jgi:hypothetical protein